MEIPSPRAMMEQIGALPAAAPLLLALGDRPGVHLVGGAVRDLLLGREALDLDLVVEGDAVALARALGGELHAHDRFGTGTVALDGRTYDLAGARRERYAHPGALPDVEPATLAEDLARRDFAVNALAVALTGPAAGTLTTVPDALADLEAGRLRVLHDASFTDDPTRLLRLARYAARLDFAAAPRTRRLAVEAIAAGALATVSGPRVGQELRLALREGDPVASLGALAGLGIDRAIHPGLGLSDPAALARALALLGPDGRRDLLALAVAALAVPGAQLPELLDRLAFTAAERDIVLAAVGAPELARALVAAQRPSQIAAAIAGAPPEAVALAGALGAQREARRWLGELRHVGLAIGGDDLLSAGIAAGPAIGRGLAAARAAALDGNAPDAAAQLAVALAAARG